MAIMVFRKTIIHDIIFCVDLKDGCIFMKKKISVQKIFNLVSFIFLFSCCFFYGGRFLIFYLENNKKVVNESDSFGNALKETNENALRMVNNVYYFTEDAENNYAFYSGILFRTIKIEDNNVVTLIAEDSITSLALGNKKGYIDSYINRWLNKSDSDDSINLESKLNSAISYLKKSDICVSNIDDINDYSCSDYNYDYYISSLDIYDYINTGGQNGFINNKQSFYLSNVNKNNEVYIINDEGKIGTANSDTLYGIRPVIKLKENLDLISGDGTRDNPFVIESDFGLFGSYVKLDDDIYRVIDFDDDNVKLMLDNYMYDKNDIVSYKYSLNSSYHDDTKYNTLAYYMNKTFLNSLSYKNIIIESNYANGYYGNDNNYDYSQTLEKTVNTKVALVSIGDVILNHDLTNYFTMTSNNKKGNYVYVVDNSNNYYTKLVSSTSRVVPVITIGRDNLTNGSGTKSDPLKVGE